jgi:hypothetical protein
MAKSGAERVRDSMQRKRDEGWRMYQIFCSPADQRAIEKARKESTLAEILVAGAEAISRGRAGRR